MPGKLTPEFEQQLTPERIEALTARAHQLRDEYIARSLRRFAAQLRQRLGLAGSAPRGGLAGSH